MSSNGREDPLAILAGVRTPFIKAGTSLKRSGADDLAAAVISELVARTEIDPGTIDEVVIGCVGQPWDAMNVARVAAIRAGVPETVPGLTLHRNCASSMEALTYARDRVRLGDGSLFIVGGTESMSSAPLTWSREMQDLLERFTRAKSVPSRLKAVLSFRLRFLKPGVPLLDGLSDKTCGLIMGLTAENLVRDFGITREEQDAFALRSHRLASSARSSGRLAQEIVPLPAPPDFEEVVREDNGIRDDQSAEALAKLRPFFDRRYGTVTVGNACPVTDGAAALLVSSERRARELGLEPLGYLTASATAALDPSRMGLGPVYAMSRLFERTGLTLADMELIELNEAFAAQVLACIKAAASASFARDELGRDAPLGEVPLDRLNVNGGAIALGHPVGASGARLVLTLLLEMRRRGLHRGLATLCVGGGLGAALVLERHE
ncbi:MAG: thiolase family protein [Planctomycetota bacterium]